MIKVKHQQSASQLCQTVKF